jgi:hypothetical protein
MPAFVEKLVAEFVVSLCVGVVLALISPLLSTSDEAVQQSGRSVCRRCGSNAPMEVESDQVRLGDEHHSSAFR